MIKIAKKFKCLESIKFLPKMIAKKILEEDLIVMKNLHDLEISNLERKYADYMKSILLQPRIRIKRVYMFNPNKDAIPFEISWGIPDELSPYIPMWNYRITINSRMYDLLKSKNGINDYFKDAIMPCFFEKFCEQMRLDIDE